MSGRPCLLLTVKDALRIPTRDTGAKTAASTSVNTKNLVGCIANGIQA